MSLFTSPGSILGRTHRESLEETKVRNFQSLHGASQSLHWPCRACTRPLHFPLLSIARLIPGHRCGFWMSDPETDVFLKSAVSSVCLLHVSISACTLGSHCLLHVRRVSCFHTQRGFTICSDFCKRYAHSSSDPLTSSKHACFLIHLQEVL